jgi:hypothetical protein
MLLQKFTPAALSPNLHLRLASEHLLECALYVLQKKDTNSAGCCISLTDNRRYLLRLYKGFRADLEFELTASSQD